MDITVLPDQDVPQDWLWHTSCKTYHPYQGKHFRMRLINNYYKAVIEGTLVDIKLGGGGHGYHDDDFLVYKDNSGKEQAININKHLGNSTIVFDNAEVLFFSDIRAYPRRLPTSISDILDLIKK
jgi:hypothetical protein